MSSDVDIGTFIDMFPPLGSQTGCVQIRQTWQHKSWVRLSGTEFFRAFGYKRAIYSN